MSSSTNLIVLYHSQQGLVKDGNHLGGSRSGSSKQIRIIIIIIIIKSYKVQKVEIQIQMKIKTQMSRWAGISECGPVHPLGCRLNQGSGIT